MRYKHESARRIQRCWKNSREGAAFYQLRDYGHEVLGNRKERRRYSLLGSRRFLGDYLDVGGKSPQGELLKNAAGLGGKFITFQKKAETNVEFSASEAVAFSARGQSLTSKLLRSSKLTPRFFIIVRSLVNLLVQITKMAPSCRRTKPFTY
jgi:myosin I